MSSGPAIQDWICCQLGAREHYAVPRAVHRLGRLRLMITDAWVTPNAALGLLPGELSRRLSERWHSDLESATVRDLTFGLVKHEIESRLFGRGGWDGLIARNEWFQEGAVAVLSDLDGPPEQTVLFAHSYSALRILRLAKARGWTTVLGQIDPGVEHFKIVQRLAEASPDFGSPPPPPPSAYFERWHEECALADHIVVNSEWSREALTRAGVDARRIHILPLAYEEGGQHSVARSYPDRFTAERPLRLLFVGSVSLVKGVVELIDAMALLGDEPVTLTLVGSPGMPIPESWRSMPSIRLAGAVPRSEMTGFYATHDVLVFPSHSDGFGMAQIEAQGAAMPIIASRHCGSVVADGINGIVLPAVTADAITAAIRSVIAAPSRLGAFSEAARVRAGGGLAALGAGLIELVS